MARFVRPEPIEGSTAVVRVFDAVHMVHRASRTLDAPPEEWPEIADRLRLVARVTHPNMVRIAAIGEDQGYFKVVTEWLPGGRPGSGRPAEVARLMEGPADALYALHRVGIAHGSVSLDALLLDGDGVVRWVDAGLRVGSVQEDLSAFGLALGDVFGSGTLPGKLSEVVRRAVTGGYGDAAELRDALRDVGAALSTDEAMPVVRAEQEDREERLRVGWLLLAFLPALVLITGAAGLGLYAGLSAPGVDATPRGPVAPVSAPVATDPPVAPTRPHAAPAEVVPAQRDPSDPPDPVDPGVPSDPTGPPELPAALGSEVRVVVVTPIVDPPSAVVAAPARVPPKPPSPVAPKAVRVGGGFVVSTEPGKRHPTVIASLDATNLVEDRLARKGRPRLEVRCQDRLLTVSLRPGVASVDAVVAENTMYSTHAEAVANLSGRSPEPLKLRMIDNDPRLYFPQSERWVGLLRGSRTLDLSYTPFASHAVVANFELLGLEAAVVELSKNCRL